MKQQLPTNDIDRAGFLQTATDAFASRQHDLTAVPAAFQLTLTQLKADFCASLDHQAEALRQWKAQRTMLDESLILLSQDLRLAYASLRLHLKQGRISAADGERLGLSMQGTITLKGPQLQRLADIKAQQLVAGLRALASSDESGLPLIPNQSMIETFLQSIARLREATSTAKAAYEQARQALRTMRQQFRTAIVNLRTYLGIAWRGLKAIALRNNLRAFGFRFTGENEQPPEPETTAEPEPQVVGGHEADSVENRESFKPKTKPPATREPLLNREERVETLQTKPTRAVTLRGLGDFKHLSHEISPI